MLPPMLDFTKNKMFCFSVAGYLNMVARTASAVEPFSGVEIHMEIDMEWKWIEIGHNL